MSLSKFDTSKNGGKVATLKVLNPLNDEELTDSKGNPMEIDLVSIDSVDYKKTFQRIQNNRIRAAASKGGQLRVRIEEAQADQIELLVACTKGWRALEEEEGQPVPFSLDAAREIYGKYDWLREQATAFQSNRANYLGN